MAIRVERYVLVEHFRAKAPDDTGSLRLLTEILVSEGYRVRPAERPQAAIKSAVADPPALILLDVKMPEMSGFEAPRPLKQDYRTKNISIIFVSGLKDLEDQILGFEAGGVDYISKPFQDITHPDDLEADLEHLNQFLCGTINKYSRVKRYLRKSGEII